MLQPEWRRHGNFLEFQCHGVLPFSWLELVPRAGGVPVREGWKPGDPRSSRRGLREITQLTTNLSLRSLDPAAEDRSGLRRWDIHPAKRPAF